MVVSRPVGGVFSEPFPCNNLEAVIRPLGTSRFSGFSVFAWVDIIRQQFACIISPFPGILQANIGINPQGKTFFLSILAIFEPPPFSSLWRDFQIQATFVKQFGGFLGGFSVFNSGVGQRHGGNSFWR